MVGVKARNTRECHRKWRRTLEHIAKIYALKVRVLSCYSRPQERPSLMSKSCIEKVDALYCETVWKEGMVASRLHNS